MPKATPTQTKSLSGGSGWPSSRGMRGSPHLHEFVHELLTLHAWLGTRCSNDRCWGRLLTTATGVHRGYRPRSCSTCSGDAGYGSSFGGNKSRCSTGMEDAQRRAHGKWPTPVARLLSSGYRSLQPSKQKRLAVPTALLSNAKRAPEPWAAAPFPSPHGCFFQRSTCASMCRPYALSTELG